MSVSLILVGVVVFSGIGEAFVFTFSSETITTGYTVDFSNSHVEDGSYEDLLQEDVDVDANTTATEQWIINSTSPTGTFPDCIQTGGDANECTYPEEDKGGTTWGELPSAKDTVASDTTTSATYEDVDGLSVTHVTSDTSDILLFASIQATGSSSAKGGWRLVYDGTNYLAHERQIGTEPGNIVLTDLISSKTAGSYTFKLQHQTDGGTLTTSNSIIVAVSLHDGTGSVPANSDYVASDTVGNSWADITGLSTTVTLSATSHIWALMVFNGYHSSNNKDSTVAINIDGTRMEESKRDYNTQNQYGCVSVVTRTTTAKTSGAYTIKGEWKGVGGSTLTGEDFKLVVIGAESQTGSGTLDIQKVVQPTEATTSTSIEDILALSVSATLGGTGHILGLTTMDTDVSVASTSGYTTTSIDGTDQDIMERGHVSQAQHGSIGQVVRTTSTLSSGSKTVKGRWYTDSGNTLSATNIVLTTVALGTTVSGSTAYRGDLWQNVTAIPVGGSYDLEVRAYRTGDSEDFSIAVWDFTASQWNVRDTINSGSYAWYLYDLTSDEISGSEVRVNFTDGSDDATQTTLYLDFVGVKSFQYQYALEVRHDASGVYGQDPELQVKGYRGGAENFDVDIWNWTTSGWNDARFDSGFTGSNAWQYVHLVSDEYTDGNVRVRYVDDNPTGSTNSTLYLDCVQVVSDNTPVTIDDKIVEEYWTFNVSFAHQWNSTDPDPEVNDWVLDGNPGYLVLQEGYRTAWINGTCTDAGGSHPIYLNVSDAGSSDQEIWTLHCSNTAVVIADPIVEEYWENGIPMAHQWNSTDPDYTQDNSWILEGNPGFLSYEKGYRTVWVNGTCPLEPEDRQYPIYLNVTDGATTDLNQWTLHCSAVGEPPENDPPVILDKEGTGYFDVMVGNLFDQVFTAYDPEGDTLWWSMATDNPYLSLWYDDKMAGVYGVPEIIGVYTVTLTVGDVMRAENFDTHTFTVEVVTEDLTDCINCYVQGEIVLEDVFLNKYTYKLVTTSVTCRVQFYVWEFGDGTHKTTYGKTVEHWYWEPWFSTQWVNVSVQGYTDCGTARPLKEQMYVDNSWEIWICMLVLLVTSALLMRRAIQSQSRKNPALKRGGSRKVKGEAR